MSDERTEATPPPGTAANEPSAAGIAPGSAPGTNGASEARMGERLPANAPAPKLTPDQIERLAREAARRRRGGPALRILRTTCRLLLATLLCPFRFLLLPALQMMAGRLLLLAVVALVILVVVGSKTPLLSVLDLFWGTEPPQPAAPLIAAPEPPIDYRRSRVIAPSAPEHATSIIRSLNDVYEAEKPLLAPRPSPANEP